MRAALVLALFATALAGCYSRTVEERPVVVQPPAQAQAPNTVVVPPGSVVVPAH